MNSENLSRDENGNVIFNKEIYNQVCVWEGTTFVNQEEREEFITWVNDELGVEALFLEEIKTNPSKNQFGENIPETGGRNDVFFAVNLNTAKPSFPLNRLRFGIRWIEDAIGDWNNPNGIVYPSRVYEYRNW